MIGKKINQLATELAPVSTDLTIIGDPISGVSKKITLAQLGAIFSGAVSFYTNLAGFPATGDINVIYCAKDTQKLYLWSGSAYVEVFPSQALLDTYQLRSEKGVSNGYASLDSSGKVPISQLPSSIMEYKGTWNAATNTPTLANGTGDTGDVYICNVAGTVNFGAGPITFAVGDYVIYSGSIWQRSSGAVGTVTSVAASITGNAIGITGSPVTTSGTLAFAFAGTGAQYIKGDGTLATFPSTIAQAERLITEVYNSTGATLTKGTIVYINGGQGNLPTVTKALATGDSTSAQTFGVVQADITNNNNGYVVVAGKLSDLDTQAYTEGTQLYLSSTTAGAWTSTKQYAPAHLVYVGIVVRAHPTQGIVEIKIQNGYELDEIHNVAAQTPTNNDGLFWEASTSLWKNKSISTILGGTPVTGSGTLYALTKWGFTSGTIINSNLYDTGSVIYNNNATAGAFAVQFNGNATSGMSYGLLINAGSDANDIALRIQNVSSTSEYFFVYGDGKVKMNNIPNATTDTDTFLVSDGGFIKYRTGAQLLSDIGGQAALTNPVTGTGTTNYLPKFTGTSTIGNSLVYDNGTNVGIGTATPYSATNYKFLTIDGTNGSGFVTRVSSINSFLAYSNSGGTTLSEQRALPIVFETTGTSRMTLDASGNLGLGVSSPSAKLQIKQSTSNWYDGIRVFDGSSNTWVGIGNTGTASVIASSYDNTGSFLPLVFYTSDSEKMRLNASGNLSIGNTNDTYKLDVSGTGRFTGNVGIGAAARSNNALTIINSGSNNEITFEGSAYTNIYSETTLGIQFGINTTGNSAGIEFLTNNTTRLTIASTGAATFSSSVTATSLNVVSGSSASFSLNVDQQSTFAFGSTNGRRVAIIRDATAADNGLQFGYDTIDKTGIIAGSATSAGVGIDFYTYNGSTWGNRMRLTKDGSVGIGTTSPDSRLHVGLSNGAQLRINYASSGDNYYDGVTHYFRNSNGAANIMTLLNSGNVGIGTTSPTTYSLAGRHLELNDAGGGYAFYHCNTTNVKSFLATNESAGLTALFTFSNHPLTLGTNNTERMRITSGGNVRIVGGGDLEIYPASGSSYTALYNDNDNFSIWNNGSERMRITSGGNVGIGTTSPSEKLEVNGNIKTAAPSGGSAGSWKLGTFTSGSATIGGKVRVEINGVAYDLLTT